MTSNKKVAPLDQGSLRTIYEHFFSPLLCYKPDDLTLRDWMENLFHLDFRNISQYTARRDFELPGLFYIVPQVKIQGIGYRNITKGDAIFVRKDTRDDFYDVQFFGGVGEADQCFQLSESQWNSIGALLEPTEGGISRGKRERAEKRELNRLKKEAK